MSEPVEVAIKKGLLGRLATFAASNSLTVSYPNTDFTKPEPGRSVQWLRATILPADSQALGIAYTDNQRHYGILQVDVFQGQGIGELAPSRVASALIAYFAIGTRITTDGFNIDVIGFNVPRVGPMIKDDPWVFVPVRIPFNCFATPA